MQFNAQYTQLASKLYHHQKPNPLLNPQAGHFNHALADELKFSGDWVALCSGQHIFDEFEPLAMVYAGHQFGQWAGQLGDGRGLLIAQVVNTHGQTVDLHLKGAGKTPYSRMGDGRAVLRSVIREYLAGHALNSLGVTSSNALGFTSSRQGVQREKLEPGAMMLRTSDCHIRLGHFEWINQYAPELLADFTQKCIEWHYPHLLNSAESIIEFALNVIERTAKMVANWQLVGFAHGVMNTDNLNITGSTLDFGPFGFMERFRPDWQNNHSDHSKRYTYQKQPSIAKWNLWVWVNNLRPLVDDEQALLATIEHFEPTFLKYYKDGLAQKMGLPSFHKDSFDCGLEFLQLLQKEQLDYTQSFWRLQQQEYTAIQHDCIDPTLFEKFITRYHAIREHQDINALQAQMKNPRYILRNHMAQKAIECAEYEDFSEVDRLFKLLADPFNAQPELEQPSDLLTNEPALAISCSS